LAPPQAVPTFPTPSTMAIPGVAPAARPNPAPFKAPIAFPLVGASTCASGTNPATGSPMVLSSARTSSVGDCGSGGRLIAQPQGPAHTASTRTIMVIRRVAPVMALPPCALPCCVAPFIPLRVSPPRHNAQGAILPPAEDVGANDAA